MHAGADLTTSTGTSAGRPSWFLDSASSSANTSPEQGHDSQKTTGQPLLIQQPYDNLFANSAGYALVPRGPYQWLTAHWAEISAKADANLATLSTSILQDTPAQPEGLEAVIRVVGPRTRNVAAFALHLAQRSGFSVQIGWAVRAKKQGVSTRAGNTYDGGSSLNGGGDERHLSGGGDDHPNGGGGEDEDCPDGRNDDGRGGNDRRRDGVGRGRRGEGEGGNDDGHGGNGRRRDGVGRGEGEGGTDGPEIDEQRVYTSQILWGQENLDEQFFSEVILESDQTLPQPPRKTDLKLTINFQDSPQLQIRKGYLCMWATKGQRLRGYPTNTFQTITNSRTRNVRFTVGTTGASTLGIPASIQIDAGRGRSQTLIRPHYHLESTGNLGPGQLRLSASWTLSIKPACKGQISDDMNFDINIIPIDLEQDFRLIISYHMTHRPNPDLPIDDSFVLLHEISVSDLRKFPTDIYSLGVNHLEALSFHQEPTELASLVQRIHLNGRQTNNDITSGLGKLNLPVQPRNILQKLRQKIRQRMGRAKVYRILSEPMPLITVRPNGHVDTYSFSAETLKNRLLFDKLM